MEVLWCDVSPWLAEPEAAYRFCAAAGIRREEFLCPEDLIPHAAGRFLLWEGFRRRCPGSAMPTLTAEGEGKPCFAGGGPCFSISHAGQAVLCALDSQPLGVDVEPVAPVEPGLLEFLCPEERAYVRRQGERGFYRVWTRKESLLKAQGWGLDRLAGLESVVTPAGALRRSVGAWRLRALDIPLRGYVASAALAVSPGQIRTVEMTLPGMDR